MIGGKPLFAFIGGGTIGAAESLTAAITIHTLTVPFKCRPFRFGFTITTATVSTGNIVVTATAAGGTTGNCGTLTIATGKAAGQVYYENTDYISAGTGAWSEYIHEGDQVVVAVGTAAAGGGAAGAGIPWLLVEIDPEIPANNSVMNAG